MVFQLTKKLQNVKNLPGFYSMYKINFLRSMSTISSDTSVKKSENEPTPLRISKEYAEQIGWENVSMLKHFPKKLFRKTAKPSNELYFCGSDGADKIVEELTKDARRVPILEINPGIGFLTRKLLDAGVQNLHLFEYNDSCLRRLEKLYGDRITCTRTDFCNIGKLVYQDRQDQGNRIAQLFENILTSKEWSDDIVSKIFIATGSTIFFNHMINSIVNNNSLFKYGRHEIYAVLPPILYLHLTCSGQSGYYLYRAASILFQILFEFEFLCKLNRRDFLPWPSVNAAKRIENLHNSLGIEVDSLYFVKITPRRNLHDYCPQDQLQQLNFFVKQNCTSRKNRAIPKLEQWIPYCGQKLILSNSTSKNKILHHNNSLSEYYSHCYELSTTNHHPDINIFTEFVDLTPNEILTLFTTFRNMPEFVSSSYTANVEEYLTKQETSEEQIEELDPTKDEIIESRENQ